MIPGQSTCLGCRLYPWWGPCKRQPFEIMFSSMFLFFSFSLPLFKNQFKRSCCAALRQPGVREGLSGSWDRRPPSAPGWGVGRGEGALCGAALVCFISDTYREWNEGGPTSWSLCKQGASPASHQSTKALLYCFPASIHAALQLRMPCATLILGKAQASHPHLQAASKLAPGPSHVP